MTAQQIASRAVDFWRASNATTLERLDELIVQYGESTYGAPDSWTDEERELLVYAQDIARRFLYAHEVER